MTKEQKPSVREQVLAELELAQQRLADFRTRLAKAPGTGWPELEKRFKRTLTRAEELAAKIEGADRISASTKAATEDLGAAVDTLDADLDVAAADEANGYRVAVDRQLRTWRGRADSLRLQSSLAAMDARDELEMVGDRIAKARGGAMVEMRKAVHDTREVAIDVRDDVERVLLDVRHAVERAADALTRSDSD